MNPELTKLIEQYLSGELSAADVQAFENRMETNEMLRDAVSNQREIHEAAKRAYQRQQIETIGKRYHFRKNLLKGGLSILILGVITAASLFVYNEFSKNDEIPVLSEKVRAELNERAPMDLETQYFLIPEEGGVVMSKDGVLISVPKGAFLKNGKPYKDPVALQFQEALKETDIVLAGLSTTSNGKLLETGGMLSVTGYTIEGKPLDFNPKIGVYVQVPMQDSRSDMQLYDGELQADGTINWVHPKELQKIPVPVPMKDLDFYPSGYERYLDTQKWKTSKSSRDSLYLSFEEDGCDECSETISFVTEWEEDIEIVLCEIDILPEEIGYLYGEAKRPVTGHITTEEFIRLANWNEGPRFSGLFGFFNSGKGFQIPPEISNHYKEKGWIRPISATQMKLYDDKEIFHFSDNNRLSAVNAQFVQDESDSTETNLLDMERAIPSSYIYPSNVLGFWNEGFNNTNLSTREFERRMQAIHQTCDNAVLKVYTSNLDKSLKECDERVIAMGHTEFELFAAENVGKVKTGNPHLKQLQRFYDKSIKQLKNRNAILQKTERARQSDHDAKTNESRKNEAKRTAYREAQAYNEEYNYNLNNVYKQFGYTRGFTITSSSRGIATNNARSAVKNIDRLVTEATQNRQSLTIEKDGKTASINYNQFTFEVENTKEYIKLFAYVLPYELNSYQRIEGKNGKFNHPLNNDIRYNVAVVGVKKDGYGIFQKLNIKGGNLGKIKLQTVSKRKLDSDVKQLNNNRNNNTSSMLSELAWLEQEQKDYKEQQLRKEMEVFRSEIRSIIFPCCPGSRYGSGQGVQSDGVEETQDENEPGNSEFGSGVSTQPKVRELEQLQNNSGFQSDTKNVAQFE